MWLLCTSVLLLIEQYCKVNIYSFLKVFFKYFLLFLFAFYLSNSYYMYICILYVCYICMYVCWYVWQSTAHISSTALRFYISFVSIQRMSDLYLSFFKLRDWFSNILPPVNFQLTYCIYTAEFLLDIFSNLSHYSLLLYFYIWSNVTVILSSILWQGFISFNIYICIISNIYIYIWDTYMHI